MSIAIDPRESIDARAVQFSLKIREVARHAKEIVDRIDGVNGKTLELPRLSDLQDSLYQQKNDIQTWPFGSLTSADVRGRVAEMWPSVYTNAADVLTQIQTANAMFNTLTASISSVLVASDLVRPRIDNDDTTGQQIVNSVPAGETAQLRIDAAAIVAFMVGTIPA